MPSDAPLPSRPGFWAMPAVHPMQPEGARTFAWITVSRARRLAVNGPGKPFQALRLVPTTLASPEIILRIRTDDGERWCYARRHGRTWRADGQPIEAPRDSVFLVELSPRLLVEDWRWVPCHPLNRALPFDDRTREGIVTWRKTT
jgi:hypothetical protein